MLTQSTVSNMFNSHAEPKLSTLRAILEACDMTLTEFFSRV
ncbi:MAG: helix-turn-helix domain-containing protein [Christensenellales bacterium]